MNELRQEAGNMIDLDGMISIPYLKKTTFTGSEKEMNFMIQMCIRDRE